MPQSCRVFFEVEMPYDISNSNRLHVKQQVRDELAEATTVLLPEFGTSMT